MILIAAFALGIGSYLYTLLIARFVRPTYSYEVIAVNRPARNTIEVVMRQRRRRAVRFIAGQFVFVSFRRWGLREPHPFTVSSAPGDDALRLTIKASRDFTTRLHDRLDAGQRATVEGSYGMLDYRRGAQRQIWVAGGIGVTPFLSWMRSLNEAIEHSVVFIYTVRTRDDALFWDEISQIADRFDQLAVRLHVTAESGRLTADAIASITSTDATETDVYLCGPVPMVKTLEAGLRRAGVPADSIHYEEFSFR